jgi:hypothetical protein
MLLSEVGWNTPPFLTQGSEDPNDFLSPGSEMKWTPLHLGRQCSPFPGMDTFKKEYFNSSPRIPKFLHRQRTIGIKSGCVSLAPEFLLIFFDKLQLCDKRRLKWYLHKFVNAAGNGKDRSILIEIASLSKNTRPTSLL